MHRQEPRPQILSLSGNEFEYLGQPTQHRHLALAGIRGWFGRSAQTLYQFGRARGWGGHIETAHPGQLDDLGVGHDPDQGVTVIAARTQDRKNTRNVLFKEKQVRYDQIGLFNGFTCHLEGARRLTPFGRRVDRD